MRIDTYVCGSCAVNSIVDLGTQANALAAMKEFCRLQLGTMGGFTKKYQILINFYVFCAGPEVPGYGHSKLWVKYGSEFAEYIRQNKLGEIVTTPAKPNLRYHPNTTAQAWLWSPDQKAMEEWWDRAQGRTQPPVEPLKEVTEPVKEVKRVVPRRRIGIGKRIAKAGKAV